MYQLAAEGQGVLLNGAFVPASTNNRDWRKYLAWLADGGSPDPAPSLALADQQARTRADVVAEAAAFVREKLPDAAHAYVYQLEAEEAEAAVASTDPLVATDYPLLAALIGDLGTDIAEVALTVVARQDAIAARIATLHTKRTEALVAIAAATSSAEVLAIVDAIEWPAEAGAPSSI